MGTIDNKKEWLKENGIKLRELRQEIAETQKNGGYAGGSQWNLETAKSEYRCQHIAYSMAKGNAYRDIEQRVRPDNEPNWNRIGNILGDAYGLDIGQMDTK